VVDASQELERGRTSFERRAWLDAYTALSEADRLEPLGATDLDLLATSASLLGRMDDYLTVLERAHLAHLERGNNLAAARAAGWLKPKHDRGVVESEPGLYFLGLIFLYSLSSDVLPGVGRDAEYVAKHIASRLTQDVKKPGRALATA
jgi:hypothetical protein